MTHEQITFAVETLRATGRLHQLIGWSFAFFFPVGTGRRVFTAQLTPVGRGSTVQDWEDLGRMAAALGAPADAMPVSVRTDPNGVHRWEWRA